MVLLDDEEPVPPVALLPEVEPVPEPEVEPVPEVPPLSEPDAVPLAEPLAPVPLAVSVLLDEAEDDGDVAGVDGVTTVVLDEDGEVAGVAVVPDEVVEEEVEAGRSQPVAKAAASARAAVRETIFIEYSMADC